MENVTKRTLVVSRPIEASAAKVWDALTNPEMVAKYFWGTRLECDWKKGSPITFAGEWEGKSYIDKGVIKEIKKGSYVRYSYLTSWSGKEDLPENYQEISYNVSSARKGLSILTISQTSYDSFEKRDESRGHWLSCLDSIKNLCEQ